MKPLSLNLLLSLLPAVALFGSCAPDPETSGRKRSRTTPATQSGTQGPDGITSAARGGGFNASVDGDDGRLDGFAFPARGWSSTGDLNFPFMGFEILPLAGGALPVWFGFAITHVNPPNTTFPTMLEIIGGNSVLLANLDLSPLEAYVRSIPLDALANPVGNDVFVSWQSSEPIQQIRITGRNSMVLDLFQFGHTIPEPSSAAMLAVSFILAARIRRRRVPS